MDEKLTGTVHKIKLLAEQNPEFRQEMQRLFGKTVSASPVNGSNDLLSDLTSIREALEIRGNKSISYDFIKERRLREQLYIDNLRMENAALNLKDKELERFYTFCVNAFYQVENIVNYFFHITFPAIDDLLYILEESTKNDGENGKFGFKRSQKEPKEKNVSDIQIFHKINALCNMLFPEDTIFKITLGNLRKVRNEGEHRCQVIYNQKNEKDSLYQFLQKSTFNSVRITLIKLVSSIKEDIQNPKKEEIVGFIENKLPGTCFISYSGKTKQIPEKFFKKVKHLNKGDKLLIMLSYNILIDIKEYK